MLPSGVLVPSTLYISVFPLVRVNILTTIKKYTGKPDTFSMQWKNLLCKSKKESVYMEEKKPNHKAISMTMIDRASQSINHCTDL